MIKLLKKSISILISFALSYSLFAQDQPDGFASVSGRSVIKTTGGQEGETVNVYSLSELRTYAGSSKPYTILVNGVISSPSATELNIGSNKTLIGVGDSTTLENIELHMVNVQNIIIRNLTIREVGWAEMSDGDGLQADNSHHIWIDHCRFDHCYDGLIDLRMVCDYITVSWTVLSNHNKTFGIGWTDEQDFRKTIHHCWFNNVMRRNPSLGAGINHLYNNYLKNIDAYGNLGRGASINVIENSWFENASSPIGADDTSEVFATGNIFVNCTGSTKGNVNVMPFNPQSFYHYSPEPANQIIPIIVSGAGPHTSISNQYTNTTGKQFTVSTSLATEHGSISPNRVASEGERVTVTATAFDGYQFDHWNIDEFGSTNPATFFVNSNIHLEANFRIARYTVYTSVEGKGSVTPENAVFQIGRQATLTAMPAEGWVFDHWEGDFTGTNNPASFMVNTNLNIKACFKQLQCIFTGKVIGNGSINPVNEIIDINKQLTITATASDNWAFDQWGGDFSGNENPATITISKDMTVTAFFKQLNCNVTTRVLKGKGTVDPANTDYNTGETVTVTAIPDQGWLFDYWTGHLTGNTNPLVFTIEHDMRLTAYFIPDTTTSAVIIKKENIIEYNFNEEISTLFVKTNSPVKLNLYIFSSEGKKLLTKKLMLNTNWNIPLQELKSGVYFIQFEIDGRIEQGRIVLPY